MKRFKNTHFSVCALILGTALAHGAIPDLQVATDKGVVEGTMSGSGIRIFRGIPFAAPPVGDLRWKAPQPAASWSGVRSGREFAAHCMQRPIYGNMGFRTPGMSEDCLYLNVWAPSNAANGSLPVLVYFFGGGMQAGDGSEPRYDGESMALRGMVAVTISYRVSVFGFMAHPELSAEAPYKASGNYGLLDQNAALKWVQANIAAFGGDPKRVTIAGESAGARSVSVQLISPLSKDMFSGAIMESGTLIGTNAPTLAEGEQQGKKFMALAGAVDLKALRAMPAKQVLDLTTDFTPNFNAIVDNHVVPATDLVAYLEGGKQTRVPILHGFNSEEDPYREVLGKNPATPEGFAAAVKQTFPSDSNRVLALYPTPKNDEEAMDAAMQFGAERGQGYRAWLLSESHIKGTGKPVYRYLYLRPRKRFVGAANEAPGQAGGVVTTTNTAPRPQNRGAAHSAEIEYAMGTLHTNSRFAWEPGDYLLSQTMQTYFANFIKTGDPNGGDLPKWPAYSGKDGYQIMHLDVHSKAGPEAGRTRYLLFDQIWRKSKPR